jgi:hypothetical protein
MKQLPNNVVSYKRTPEFTLEPETEVVLLDTTIFGVVEPTVLHEVTVLGKVRFYVEFYR